MSSVNIHHNLSAVQPFGFLAAISRRLKERRELNALLSMPDYQLRDMGITRGDIARESLKPLWRE